MLFSWGCSEQPEPAAGPQAGAAKQGADKTKTAGEKTAEGETPAAKSSAVTSTNATAGKPTREEILKDSDKKIAQVEAGAHNGAKQPNAKETSSHTNWDEYIKAGGPIDTRFIPADAFAAIIAYPARVWASPGMAKLDWKDLNKGVEGKFGSAVSDIEQVQVLFSMAAPAANRPGGPPNVEAAVEIRLAKPYGGEKLVKRIISDSEPVKVSYAGKTYYMPGKTKYGYQPSAPAVYLVDERTFLIGDEPEVKAMLAAKGEKTPLVQLLGKVDPTADLTFVGAPNEQLRKMVADAKAKQALPPPAAPFGEAADLLTGSIVSIKTMPEISLAVTLVGKDKAAADKLAAMLPPLKQMADQGVNLLHQLASTAPPEEKKAIDFGLAKLDKIVAGLIAQRKGSNVVVEIGGLGTIDDLASRVILPEITRRGRRQSRIKG